MKLPSILAAGMAALLLCAGAALAQDTAETRRAAAQRERK